MTGALFICTFTEVSSMLILSIRIITKTNRLTWDPTLNEPTSILVDIFTKLFILGYCGEMFIFTKLIFRDKENKSTNNQNKLNGSATTEKNSSGTGTTTIVKINPKSSIIPSSQDDAPLRNSAGDEGEIEIVSSS